MSYSYLLISEWDADGHKVLPRYTKMPMDNTIMPRTAPPTEEVRSGINRNSLRKIYFIQCRLKFVKMKVSN